MFNLADMMMHVEIAASLVRRAASFVRGGNADAEKIRVFSKLFANEVSELLASNILRILLGSGRFEPEQINSFLAETSHTAFTESYRSLVPCMDRAADIIFERTP
jgi:alkylation response protein AidB-like acyl-CoA dehydrogenase